jgi:hypothetical protein
VAGPLDDAIGVPRGREMDLIGVDGPRVGITDADTIERKPNPGHTMSRLRVTDPRMETLGEAEPGRSDGGHSTSATTRTRWTTLLP